MQPGPTPASTREDQDGILVAGPLGPAVALTNCLVAAVWGLGLTGTARWAAMGLAAVAACIAWFLRTLQWSSVPLGALTVVGVVATPLFAIASWLGDGSPAILGSLMVAEMWFALLMPVGAFGWILAAHAAAYAGGAWVATGQDAEPFTLAASVIALVALAVIVQRLKAAMATDRLRTRRAQEQLTEREAELRAADEAAERARAEAADAELAERARLMDQIAERAAQLAASAGSVTHESDSVAMATDELSTSIAELARTAQVTQAVSDQVGDRAEGATAVIQRLADASTQIMAASEVIQAIAEQTNLLALNATIESARAGEAGRGFAVVAGEVKDLAQQSGKNADHIATTLGEVQRLVAEAVAEVHGIGESMTDLRQHSSALAVAIEEQSSVVHQINQSVTTTAGQVASMAAEVRALQQLSTG